MQATKLSSQHFRPSPDTAAPAAAAVITKGQNKRAKTVSYL